MNARGYDIQGIYMSGMWSYQHIQCLYSACLSTCNVAPSTGGQAANSKLMQLFANTCNIPVILPHEFSAAVVIGSAMLGRFAAEVSAAENGKVLAEQKDAERVSKEHKERLWGIMVEMTQPGKRIDPAASDREKKLLQAKYEIFREAIEIQRRWRKTMAEAAGEN